MLRFNSSRLERARTRYANLSRAEFSISNVNAESESLVPVRPCHPKSPPTPASAPGTSIIVGRALPLDHARQIFGRVRTFSEQEARWIRKHVARD